MNTETEKLKQKLAIVTSFLYDLIEKGAFDDLYSTKELLDMETQLEDN